MKFQENFWNLSAVIRTDAKTKTVYFVDGTTLELKNSQEFGELLTAMFHHDSLMTKRGK